MISIISWTNSYWPAFSKFLKCCMFSRLKFLKDLKGLYAGYIFRFVH